MARLSEIVSWRPEPFFAAYRAVFGKIPRPEQVAGLEFLVPLLLDDERIKTIPQAAYVLTTAAHETAWTFQPIAEYGDNSYLASRYDPVLGSTAQRRVRALRMGNLNEGDGVRYKGRGYVQLTWRDNYRRAGKALGIDLETKPEGALIPEVAYEILVQGMRDGWFTGAKLARFVADDPGARVDFVGARRVVNGTDRAEEIARYAERFAAVLRHPSLRAGDDEPQADDAAVPVGMVRMTIERAVISERMGSRGGDVRVAQALLGVFSPVSPGIADGIAGPRFHGALVAFQRERGLVADGVLGEKSWGALEYAVK